MNDIADFVVVGAQRSGTTWLYEMLKQHPQVALGEKETSFFNDISSSYVYEPVRNYEKGISWYKRQLPQIEGKMVGDFSSNYLFDPVAAGRIAKHLPNTKIIVLLREPVSRALSQFRLASQYFFIGDNLCEAIERYPDILERGRYFPQLRRLFDNFDDDQILVLLFEDIERRPVQLLETVQTFLGIQRSVPDRLNEQVNQSRTVRSASVTRVVAALRVIKKTRIGGVIWRASAVRKLSAIFAVLLRKVNTVPAKPASEQGGEYEVLKNLYVEDVKELQVFLDIDLSGWGYAKPSRKSSSN